MAYFADFQLVLILVQDFKRLDERLKAMRARRQTADRAGSTETKIRVMCAQNNPVACASSKSVKYACLELCPFSEICHIGLFNFSGF